MKLLYLLFVLMLFAQSGKSSHLKCSDNAYRFWWDILHYEVDIKFNDIGKSPKANNPLINGNVLITSKVAQKPNDTLQIDLQEPLSVQKISLLHKNKKQSISYLRKGNHYLIIGNFSLFQPGETFQISIHYQGTPLLAKNAPWDGGLVIKKDVHGNDWWSVACQGIGASVWLPCKDVQNDEPDNGVLLKFTAHKKDYQVISNGVNLETDRTKNEYTWQVTNPINWYNITFYVGKYTLIADTFNGINGVLPVSYYVLPHNIDKAKHQFTQIKPMLQCFEEKFGPYPFYKDGYKIVEAPFLGMEHQSAIAYGNNFENGYLGTDRSSSGVGLLFDFIIVHESGHEWFGNSITASDKAYSWIHEGFTSYSETILAECFFGKENALKYQYGKRKIIQNDKPIEGIPEMCDGGSLDHYDKGAFVVHMIRTIMNDDARFFELLKEINTSYYHKIVTGKEIEKFIIDFTKIDFQEFFNHYLRSAHLPVLYMKNTEINTFELAWQNTTPGFNMPVKFYSGSEEIWIDLKHTHTFTFPDQDIRIAPDFLIDIVQDSTN